MTKYIFPKDDKFYKANLHCHSNISDGALSPEELKELYKSHGYSVLAYTDHDVMIPHPELCDESFIALNGFEVQFKGPIRSPGVANEKACHICFIAKSPDINEQPCWNEKYAYIGNAKSHINEVSVDSETNGFMREYTPECINKLISICRDKGFFATYNHPAWSLESYPEYTKYEGLNAIEIYNNSAEMLGYPSYASNAYDDILRSGKRVYAVAADDNHNKPSRNDAFGGFVMIKAKDLSYESITEALFNGDFYASSGPEIKDIRIEDNKIYIECSDAVSVSLSTDRRIARYAYSSNGTPLREVAFDFNFDCEYFRITVKDFSGNRADTRAYYIDSI